MKIHRLFLLLAFFLASCAPPTPAPTATSTPTPTSTMTLIPTVTQTPTSTPTPETWVSGVEANTGIELSAELFESIKDQNPILSESGEQILNAETTEVLLERKNGEWEMLAKSFPENRNISEFNSPENYVPPEQLLNGDYEQWIRSEILPQVEAWFNSHADKINYGIPLWGTGLNGGTFLVPRPTTGPNYTDRETAPQNGRWIFHNTVLKIEKERTFTNQNGQSITAQPGDEWLYRVAPCFFIDDQGMVSFVIAIEKYPHPENMKLANDMYIDKMNITPIGTSALNNSGFIDPLVEQFLKQTGLTDEEIAARGERFKNGDYAAFDGWILPTITSDTDWYR